MLVELAVTAGPHVGRTFQFTEHSTFIVGRSSQAHFSLPEKDPHVSRLHFLVEVNPPLCRLRNMSSVNGTLVNGTKVQQVDLKDGDTISIGVTELVVRLKTSAMPSGDDTPTLGLPGAEPATLSHVAPTPSAGAFGRVLEVMASPHTMPEEQTPLISGYQIEQVLGKGGMGIVYRARQLSSGETVAVKTILPHARVGEVALLKFVREADTLRRLDHPGIVKFRDSGIAAGTVWFAMEFVPGDDAQKIGNATKPMPVGRAVRWVVQMLEALAHAHSKGFVHRDVKPSNLLVASGPGGGEIVKLADFGLARAYEASPLSGLTLTGSSGGTPAFMPPEQVLDMRSVKPAADQYAAAATLYRLLSGQHVYPTATTVEELFAKILQTDPVSLSTLRPDVPQALTATIHRALSRDVGARFADCMAFAAAMKPFAG
jgi:serine/threonine-protein kinase